MKKPRYLEIRSGRPLRPPGPWPASPVPADRLPRHDERLWRLVRGGATLYRTYTFPSPAVAASFSQLAVGLAAHVRLPLFVRFQDSRVVLALRCDSSRRISPLAAELFDRLATLS